MTFDEFIAAITTDHIDWLVKEQAIAFIQGAEIETLGSALQLPGIKAEFVQLINLSLSKKIPVAQAEAAVDRIAAEVTKPKGPK